MFFWSHKNSHVVLSDEDEMELMHLVEPDPLKSFQYHTRKEERKRIEGLMFSYLKNLLKKDYNTFHNKYLFRSLLEEKALEYLSGYLILYGWATKKATFGKFTNKTENDLFGIINTIENLNVEDDNPLIYVTIINKKLFPFPKYTYNDYISFPSKSVRKIIGTPINFTILTDNLTLSFKETNIRINAIK